MTTEHSTVDRTAQRFWEIACACRGRLEIAGMDNVQHVLMAIGILITFEVDANFRSTRPRQLARLNELHSEMIVGQARAS